jgi:hypothetical protein
LKGIGEDLDFIGHREDVRNFVESERLTQSRDRLWEIFCQEKGVAREKTIPDQQEARRRAV